MSLRRDMGLPPHAPLEPNRLAKHLGVRLCTPRDIPGVPKQVVEQLLERDPWGWSAVSLIVNGSALVIFNPRHSQGRQASDIAHELAHLILDHDPGKLVMSQDGRMIMRSYHQKQEDEANWLAWALLLPREALVQSVRSKLLAPDIAENYGVSEKLVNFRLDMTGVNAQFRRYRGRSS